MRSDIYNQFGGRRTALNSRNPVQMIKAFKEFKSALKGDPEQLVKSMLNNGIMSQQDFQELQEMARDFQNLLR